MREHGGRAGRDLRADRDQRRAVPRAARRSGGRRLVFDASCWRPAASPTAISGGRHRRLPARAGLLSTSASTCTCCTSSGSARAGLGKLRFGAIYFTSLLTGAFGAILLSSPNSYTVGASGAVFGLMGAASSFLHGRGINPMESGLGADDPHQPPVPVPVPGRRTSRSAATSSASPAASSRAGSSPARTSGACRSCCRSSPAW